MFNAEVAICYQRCDNRPTPDLRSEIQVSVNIQDNLLASVIYLFSNTSFLQFHQESGIESFTSKWRNNEINTDTKNLRMCLFVS